MYPKENGTPEKLRTPGRRPRAAERVRLCRCSCEREGGRPGASGTQAGAWREHSGPLRSTGESGAQGPVDLESGR